LQRRQIVWHLGMMTSIKRAGVFTILPMPCHASVHF
jgi:hypothetical protein